jgi:hypothetical protein
MAGLRQLQLKLQSASPVLCVYGCDVMYKCKRVGYHLGPVLKVQNGLSN